MLVVVTKTDFQLVGCGTIGKRMTNCIIMYIISFIVCSHPIEINIQKNHVLLNVHLTV